MPHISIIIPTYNSEKVIGNAIHSILNLDYKDLEIIIIDGKSSDRTVALVQNYIELLNLIIISEEDDGIYDAMNKGINLASGNWLYFLGSDDLMRRDFSKFIKFLESSNTIYYGNVFFVNRKKIYDGKFNSYKLIKRNLPHQATLYPKSIFGQYRFNEKYKLKADYELNLKLFNDKRYKFKYLDYIIADYNDLGRSGSSGDQVFEEDKYYLIKNYFPYHVFLYYLIRTNLVKYFRFLKNLGDEKL